MAGRRELDLGMTALDEFFMTDELRKENRLPRIYDIPISEIDDAPDHPFQVRMDEDMQQLIDSIRERGIITPVILREKEDGRYEMVSGHRRKKACEHLGMDTVRAEIRELDRDEAIILMVESNLQRSVILPSEKAFSYKMRLEAMKRQVGRPSKDNLSPVATNFRGRSDDELAQVVGEGKDNIRRYIRLTELEPDLLELVDAGRIALRPAVELSYLTSDEQRSLLENIDLYDATPSHAQAIKLRAFSKEGKLFPEVIESIMTEEKPNQREKISFRADEFKKYLPSSLKTRQQTQEYVLKALEYYGRFRERQKENER